ncbi:MAG TPA: HEAT repeat domain-containing protein [Desulfomonilia bacterium]
MVLKLPGSELKKTDINRLLAATVAGGLSLALFYTIFGFIFCRHHAVRISAEMSLFAANHMTTVIRPDDPYLTSFIHQFASGSFFGLTLGLLIGIVAAAAGIVIFFTAGSHAFSRIIQAGLIAAVAAFAIVSGYSRELPYVSVIFGIFSPAVFFIPWLLITNNSKDKTNSYVSWFVFFIVLCVPLLLLKTQSFELIRDAMVETPILRDINSFYYNHTFLAADVIKPLKFRTQNAVSVSSRIGEITELPHGSLFIKTDNPCAVNGAVIAASDEKLPCRSVVLSSGAGIVTADRILKDATGDPNKALRNGIGTFLKGPIVMVPVIILGWASFGLASLFRRKPLAAIIVILCYLMVFIPGFYQTYLKRTLYADSSKIHEYASSSNPSKRYLSLIYMLDKNVVHTDGLYPDELRALAGDSRASTRLNALVLAGELRDPQFSDLARISLNDSQLNVRTKACWAIGRFGLPDAASALEGVINNDPSWYVRDYAYMAMSKFKHEAKIVLK